MPLELSSTKGRTHTKACDIHPMVEQIIKAGLIIGHGTIEYRES